MPDAATADPTGVRFDPDPDGARKLFTATERHAAQEVAAPAGVTPSTS